MMAGKMTGVGKATGQQRDAEVAMRPDALRLKDLLDRLAATQPGKKKDIKPMVEAILTELGTALARGEGVNLPGLGRARVTKSAEKAGVQHLVIKLRRGTARLDDNKPKEPLASEE